MRYADRLRTVFVLIIASLLVCIFSSAGISQEADVTSAQQQGQKVQNSQTLKFPEWDGVYLWTKDDSFVELKEQRRVWVENENNFFLPRDPRVFYITWIGFSSKDFNLFPSEKIQGLFIKGEDFVKNVKFFIFRRGDVYDERKWVRQYDSKEYLPRKRSVGTDGLLIKIDNFEKEIGLADNVQYLVIVYVPPERESSRLRFWVVGARK